MPAEKKHLVGQKTPDFTLPSAVEDTVTLHAFLGKTVLLAFIRSSGWGSCRAHLVQLRQKADELNGLGVQILAIAPDHVESLIPLQKALKLPFPLLADPQHIVFAHYEMLTGDIPTGGDIVVDKAGVVQYVYYDTPDGQIRFADLLSIVKDVVQEGA